MRRAFAPDVEAPLVVAHEVLARQDRMLLDPDDRLREIEIELFQDGWENRTIRVATPNVKTAPRLQHAPDIAEPEMQQMLVLVIREVIALQAASFWNISF